MKRLPPHLMRSPHRNAGPPKTLQELAAMQSTSEGSVTRLKELTPIRLATQRPLADNEAWSGFPLKEWGVSTSLFGGPHYLIKLYSERLMPAPDMPHASIPVFCIRWSCTHEQLSDATFRAQVEATAAAYMDMLNMRRVK